MKKHLYQGDKLPQDPLEMLLKRHPDARKCGDGYMAKCRAHEDGSPSLKLSRGSDGRALIHCFAGCKPREVLAAVGLDFQDLFPSGDPCKQVKRPSKSAVEREKSIVAHGVKLLMQGAALPESDLKRLETACRRLANLESL